MVTWISCASKDRSPFFCLYKAFDFIESSYLKHAGHVMVEPEWEQYKNNSVYLFICDLLLYCFTFLYTGWPRSYRKYILQITQPTRYGYAKLQYSFAVTSWSPSSTEWFSTIGSTVHLKLEKDEHWTVLTNSAKVIIYVQSISFLAL